MRTSTAAAAGRVQVGHAFVNRMGFGAMHLSDRERAHTLLHKVVERGVNFIDTADAYGPETSEQLIAEALHPYPDGLVIGTKGGLVRPRGEWEADGRPEHLRTACEGSLRRLRLEAIDLYQLHTVDPEVPLEESVGALRDLRDEGKIRSIGLSNVSVEELNRARAVVEIASVQNRYSLTVRDSERVLEACERHDIAFLPWHPLATGALTRRSGPMGDLARHHDASPAQLALGWLLHRSPKMLVIPGTSSFEHFEENVGAALLELADAECRDVERVATS